MCVCVHVSTGAYGGWKTVSDPLKLDLLVVVSYLVWVLGTKLGPSAGAVSTLNHLAISQASLIFYLCSFLSVS